MAKTPSLKTKKSPKPKPVSISRSYGAFTASWKPAYTNKTMWNTKLKINNKWQPKWRWSKAQSIGAKTTSKKIEGFTLGSYYPYKLNGPKLNGVQCYVKGQNKTTKVKKKGKEYNQPWSMSKATKASFGIAAPRPLTLTYERRSMYETAFTMKLDEHVNSGKYWATHVLWQSCLRIDVDEAAPPEEAWPALSDSYKYTIRNSVTGNDQTEFIRTINDEQYSSNIQNAKSAVRWFRARVAGPAGNSTWSTVKIAYSEPYAANVTSAKMSRNARNGLDCTLEWEYQQSISFPVDYMKVQYAMCVPGGWYFEYTQTSDYEIVSGKHYYTLTGTKVVNPIADDLLTYYDKQESEYELTQDEEVEEGKNYYRPSLVVSPVKANIETYYNNVDGTYIKTPDVEIDSSKQYYVLNRVSNPIDSEIETYYEKTNEYYSRTLDTEIIKNKRYYTVVGSIVANPIDDDLDLYYEEVKVNEVGPVSPSWQDAEIGGDNTIIPSKAGGKTLAVYKASVAFSIDTMLPEDQLLYVRVTTTHNNKTAYSKYFRCVESNTKLSSDSLYLTAPEEPTVDPPVGNRVHVSTNNNSEASGVHIAIVFIPNDSGLETEVIGVFDPNPSGEVSETVEIPPAYANTSFGIGVYAFIGQYALSKRIEEDGVGYDLYLTNPVIKSKLITYGGDIPLPPTRVEATHLGDGNVMVTWDWNWKEASSAEVAWSDYSEALDSNSPPTIYEVPNSKSNKLIIRNLELGKTWFFWVRLKKDENASIWSNPDFESLSSSPSIPSLSLSKRYITMDETFSANWTYVSADGTKQKSATICECTVDGNNVSYGRTIVSIPNSEITDPERQYVVIDPLSEEIGWSEGQTYNLAVKVSSDSGMISEKWSEPVQITTVSSIDSKLGGSTFSPAALEYDPTLTYSVGDYVIKRVIDPEDGYKERGVLYKNIVDILTPEEWNDEHWINDEEEPRMVLDALPFEVEIIPSSETLSTSIVIERAADYFTERPDGKEYGGYAGEVVTQITYSEDNTFTIDQDDLFTYLDDGADYYLVTRVSDEYGQLKEIRYEFTVRWEHQALNPVASVELLRDESIAKITIETPEIPEGDDITGDVCDIYRRSADGLEMLYEGAEFDQIYADPYPTIGDHGGYRIVYRTRNGDYTNDDGFAWIDLEDEEDILRSEGHIIDFGEETVVIMYNVDVDNSWRKDFQETHYLGGSIQGDWNSGISKTTSMSANAVTSDWNVIESMRNLANYEGVCHVRTRDGSNFVANVEVTEKLPYQVYYNPASGEDTQLCDYSLSITRLDPIETDGLLYSEWEESLPEEEEEEP